MGLPQVVKAGAMRLPVDAHPLALDLFPIFSELAAAGDREALFLAGCDDHGRLLVFVERLGGAMSIGTAMPAVREALACPKVVTLVLAHTHPCGSLSPSRADRMATHSIAALARLAGASLADHWLFAGGQAVSFRSLRLL